MKRLYLRQAELSDMNLLYRWVNDVSVRHNSFNSNEISIQEHEKWFNQTLVDNNVNIFILMLENKPIGQVRIVKKSGLQMINYSIDSEYRGQGYGLQILSLVEQRCDLHLPLVGLVKFDNLVSQCIFEKLGYIKIVKSNYFEYQKRLLNKSEGFSND